MLAFSVMAVFETSRIFFFKTNTKRSLFLQQDSHFEQSIIIGFFPGSWIHISLAAGDFDLIINHNLEKISDHGG